MADLISGSIEVSAAGRWAVVAWLFVLGGVVGSFLNVVIYRLPRGLSLIRPGSQCPVCRRPIRWYDNVPIVSWLALGGRCRDCSAPISPRYPMVEALTATISAALAWSEVFQPMPPLGPGTPATFALEFGRYALHLLLLCTLLCAAWIEWDGQVVPLRLVGSVLVTGLAVTIAWPGLQLDEAVGQWLLRGVPESVGGLLAAVWLSLMAWPAWVRGSGGRDITEGTLAAYELTLVGVFLGLRAVVAIAAVGLMLSIASQALGRWWPPVRRAGWAGSLFIATLVWIFGARVIMPLLPSWLERNPWGLPLAGGALVAVLGLLARWTRPHASPAGISTAT